MGRIGRGGRQGISPVNSPNDGLLYPQRVSTGTYGLEVREDREAGDTRLAQTPLEELFDGRLQYIGYLGWPVRGVWTFFPWDAKDRRPSLNQVGNGAPNAHDLGTNALSAPILDALLFLEQTKLLRSPDRLDLHVEQRWSRHPCRRSCDRMSYSVTSLVASQSRGNQVS